ncbi:MAG: hypothetical protein OIF50_17645 [Flavobacteriaceae bacterium]|nr:hypothetical protein [Flavobacteriaceae bacterium]
MVNGIELDSDYHLDLVARGKLKVTTEGYKYHSIDGQRNTNMSIEGELKFGIEAEASIKYRIGKAKGIAMISGAAEARAVWNEKGFNYEGLYAKFSARIDFSSDDDKEPNEDSEESSEDKFLIHKGMDYESKIL